MVTPSRRQPHAPAYTIIESLVVLAILTLLSMVIIALVLHRGETNGSEGGEVSEMSAAAAKEIPAEASPAAQVDANPE